MCCVVSVLLLSHRKCYYFTKADRLLKYPMATNVQEKTKSFWNYNICEMQWKTDLFIFFVIDKPKYIKDGCLPSVLQSNSNLKLESSVKKDLWFYPRVMYQKHLWRHRWESGLFTRAWCMMWCYLFIWNHKSKDQCLGSCWLQP